MAPDRGNNIVSFILHNAKVLTMEANYPRATAVAIAGDRITAVGGRELLECHGKRDQLIDCEGKLVIPGFNDAHCHPLAFALSLLSVDCRGAKSIAEIQARIRLGVEQTSPGKWIRAGGYHEFFLAEQRHPTRWELDKASPYHPLKLNHQTGHACVLNTLAMEQVGISGETPEPHGAIIDRDLETGEPNGILFGMNDYVDAVMPRLSREELERGVELANAAYLSYGITSLQDATWSDSVGRWETLGELKRQGKLVPRVSMMIGFDAMSQFREMGLVGGGGDEHLRRGAVKIVIDEVSGALNPPQPELNHMVHQIYQQGYQVALHAIEENTVRAAIEALEYALSQSQVPLKSPFPVSYRHYREPKAKQSRIEHCSECPPDLWHRVKNVGASVITQPAFLYYSGERYLATLEERQLSWLYRIGSFLKEGVRVAVGSDSPVVPLNPLVGVRAAVIRETDRGRVILSHERVSPAEALEMYTQAGACASGEEKIKGSIAPGMLADLIMLSADPTTVPPPETKEIQVIMTIAGGKIVWEA